MLFLKLRALLLKFRSEESGVTAIEYGLIAAGVGVAVAAVIFLVGDDLVVMFEGVRTQLNPAP